MRCVAGLGLFVAAVLTPVGAGAEEEKGPGAWVDFEIHATFKHAKGLVRTIAYAPDGKTLATGGSDRSLRIWDAKTGASIATHVLPRGG